MSIFAAAPGPVASSRRRAGAGTPVVLGQNTMGPDERSPPSAGYTNISKFTLASPGTLTELHMWMANTVAGQEIRVVIYDDDGASGRPGTLLAYTNSLPVPSTGVNTDLFQAGLSVPLAAGSYWIGYTSLTSGGSFWRFSSGGTHEERAGTYTPPVNPWGSASGGTRIFPCWGIVLV